MISNTEIIKFKNNHHDVKNYLDFVDSVYIMTVKKEKITERQIQCIDNINILGCQEITYWCYTRGYKLCNMQDSNQNALYNTHIIIKHAFENNFKNIIIFEDDFIFNKDIYKNIDIKKERIVKLIIQNKHLNSVIYLGYIPLTIKKLNNNIITGRFGNAHSILLNENAMKKINNYPNIKTIKKKYFDYGAINPSVDSLLYLDEDVKHYAIQPNDLFFQSSDKNCSMCQSNNSTLKAFFRIQQFFTGELYYQYSPKFVSIYENFITFISLFFNEKDPAIIIFHYNARNIITCLKIFLIFYIFFWANSYIFKNQDYLINNILQLVK